jgi:hypothetical protein
VREKISDARVGLVTVRRRSVEEGGEAVGRRMEQDASLASGTFGANGR